MTDSAQDATEPPKLYNFADFLAFCANLGYDYSTSKTLELFKASINEAFASSILPIHV
jgi:hypothetical protein